ncbi:MAG: MBL fold metallo-hydrolase [Bacteroidales bacterium]|nr:MBL fold metallo-hydrolase [Bacteroidales bacterium]
MPILKTFVFNSFSVNTYILSDETGEALIVDPACSNEKEFNSLTEYIETNKLVPVKIINTHGHIDHIVGACRVMGHYNIPFLIHSGEQYNLDKAKQTALIFGFEIDEVPVPSGFLNEGDKIAFGNSFVEAIHVPGHSEGSLVYYFIEGNLIIAGDVLFRGSVGRSDLPGGNHHTLITGIKNKLLALPGNTTVYCGHGPTTTIAAEHDTNPFLV